ncbi:MAG: Gfo/Idh/MocA family oxidoreductase [Cyclobacteriaceae bacterium]|nr:Gfo/Idh/MocA family oxidoreductase [Cyclobacteriaceae bacterium]
MNKVLLIGSGRRIQKNFIPAIACLPELFEVAGIYSRTLAHAKQLAEEKNFPLIENLSVVDFKTIDIVAISITTSAVPGILRILQSVASKLTVIVDTPVFEKSTHFFSLHLFRKFKKVMVAEDYMNFPAFELIRNAVADGAIGKVRCVSLFHNAYLHHGTALIRSFAGFRGVFFSQSIRHCRYGKLTRYYLQGGLRGIVAEPYSPLEGRLIISGASGIITDFNYELTKGNVEQLQLQPIVSDGLLMGYEIKSVNYNRSYYPPYLNKLRSLDISDKSDFNLLKTCGLIRIFESIDKPNSNTAYTLVEGVYDSLISRIARKLQFYGDPFGILFKSALMLMRKIR